MDRQPSARSLFEQAAAIARAGRPEDGIRFIEATAGQGDPQANFIVAHWLLYGSDRPRDTAAASAITTTGAPAWSAEVKPRPDRTGISIVRK